MALPRSTAAGITSGVLLLAGVVGFGVGVPEVTGSSSSSSAAVPDLPDGIEGYTALDAVPAEAAQQLGADPATSAEQDVNADKALTEEYGDASVRYYVDLEGVEQAAVTGALGRFSLTVVPGEDDVLPIFGGPYESETYEMRTIDGHRCAVAWNPPADGSEPTALDYQVECRQAVDGLVYDILAQSIAPDEVAALLTEATELG